MQVAMSTHSFSTPACSSNGVCSEDGDALGGKRTLSATFVPSWLIRA